MAKQTKKKQKTPTTLKNGKMAHWQTVTTQCEEALKFRSPHMHTHGKQMWQRWGQRGKSIPAVH